MKSTTNLLLALSAIFLTACCTNSTKGSPRREVVELACPDLTPLPDKSRDSLVRKIDEISSIYYQCKAAKLQ